MAQNQQAYNYVIDSLTLGAEATDTAEAEDELAQIETKTEEPWWLKVERGEILADSAGNVIYGSDGKFLVMASLKVDAEGYLTLLDGTPIINSDGQPVLAKDTNFPVTASSGIVGGSQSGSAPIKPYSARPSTYTADGTDPLSKQLRLKGFAHKGRQDFNTDRLRRFYKIRGGDDAHTYTARLYTYPKNDAKYDTLIVDLPAWFCQAQNSGKSVEIEYVQVFHREYRETKKVPLIDAATGKVVTDPETGEVQYETLKDDGGHDVLDDEGNPVYKEVPVPDEEQDPYKLLDCTCHSDLVQVNTSADSCLGMTNVMYSFPKKYVIGNSVQSFNMWFRDMSGKIVDVDPYKTHLIVELILRW